MSQPSHSGEKPTEERSAYEKRESPHEPAIIMSSLSAEGSAADMQAQHLSSGSNGAPRVNEIERCPVLIVDDDEDILLALNNTITAEGYRVVQTLSPLKALEYIKEDSFAVIISDQRMDEMTGLEFLALVKGQQPNASRVLITGALTLNTVIEAVNKGEIFRFLAKPWIREELLATVKNAVQRFQLLEVNRKLQANTLTLNERLSLSNAELKKKNQILNQQKLALDEANTALKSNFEHSLELCYRIIDAYHPVLGEETKAIVNICRQISDSGNLSSKDQRTLTVSAWLQNIGLIGISRDLLHRARESPESLSVREREIIYNHPIYGQTLASFVDNLSLVGETIRAHHDRWDGKGYPDRLAREAIPRPARILAIAVYFVECGLPKEEAIEAILRQSGKTFEPEAVRLFLKATRMVQLPRKVRELLFSELESGMILAQGLYSPTGLLLIPEDRELSDRTLEKIQKHNLVDPINQRILVYQ